MTLRKMFEQWQTESGRCEEMYLAHDGERYVFNDVQSDWLTFQEIAGVIVRECVSVCEKERDYWEMQAPGANDARYDWKADGAEACVEELRALLEHDNG